MYDDYGIDEINVSNSFFTVNFKDSTSMTAWRNSDRSVQFEYTGSGSKGWEGTFDLTSNEEYSVNTTYNYIQYSQYALHGNFTDGSTMADDVAVMVQDQASLTSTISDKHGSCGDNYHRRTLWVGRPHGRLISRIHELDRRIDHIEVKVAEKYVTKADMSDIIDRVTDHMVRIENKLDNLQQTIKYN